MNRWETGGESFGCKAKKQQVEERAKKKNNRKKRRQRVSKCVNGGGRVKKVKVLRGETPKKFL